MDDSAKQQKELATVCEHSYYTKQKKSDLIISFHATEIHISTAHFLFN